MSGALYLYAFVRGEERPADAGIGGAPVRLFHPRANGSAGLGALVSDASPGGLAAKLENALAHDHVLTEALARFDSVVPARFGCVIEVSKLESLLLERREEIAAEVERLAGACELAVRFARPRVPAQLSPAPGTGRQYLERKHGLAELGALETVVAPHRARLASLARDLSEARRCSEQSVEIDLSFLVDCPRAGSFRAAAEEIQARGVDEPLGVSMAWMGPWAPYSFVRLRLCESVDNHG